MGGWDPPAEPGTSPSTGMRSKVQGRHSEDLALADGPYDFPTGWLHLHPLALAHFTCDSGPFHAKSDGRFI